MTDSRRKDINYAKSELKQYMYLLGQCHDLEGKIIDIETKLEGIRSSSAPIIMGSTSQEGKEYRRNDLIDRMNEYKAELATIRHRTDKVDSFLESLVYNDRKIVTEVYIKRRNIEKVASENFRSLRMLKYYIDEILLKF